MVESEATSVLNAPVAAFSAELANIPAHFLANSVSLSFAIWGEWEFPLRFHPPTYYMLRRPKFLEVLAYPTPMRHPRVVDFDFAPM